jgi:tetratricopeptide (TPR) repeat protein
MGIAYRYLKNWDKSDQAFENLIQIAPDDPEGYFGLGINHFINDEYEKAANALEAAELLYLQSGSPYVVDAQYYLGASYYYLQDFARARGYLAPIYDLQPDDLFINLSLGISNLLLEPKDLELVKIYLLKAEALGYTLPDSLVQTLVKEFGAWPPK